MYKRDIASINHLKIEIACKGYSPSMTAAATTTAFVLVHGTGHGGWCWRFIAPMLRAAGYDVYTPYVNWARRQFSSFA
jgi:hypothetical protein